MKISTKICSTILLLVSFGAFSQSNFTKGFDNGYKEGFCHNQSIGCIEPIPPIAPIPKVEESSDSYNDGYNRGFEMGLQAREKADISTTSGGNNRNRFKTANPKFIDGVYEPNYDLQFKIASNITKGLSEASNELKEGRLDNTIFLSNKILAIMPDQLMANQLICMAYLGKYEQSKNFDFLKASYSYSQKIYELNDNDLLLKTVKSKIDNHSNSEIENKNGNENLESLIKKGYKDYKKGEFASAIANYTKYLNVKTTDTDIIFYRALAKAEIGDKYGAIKDYDQIIKYRNEHPMKYNRISTAYNNKAYSLVLLGKYKEALPIVEKALELEKEDWFIWDTRGEIHLNLNKYEESIEDYTKAIELEENSNSYLQRGMAYLKLGKKERGCMDFSKAGELGKDTAYKQIAKNCN